MARKLPGLVDDGSSLADARDVAKVMITAAEKGKRGDRLQTLLDRKKSNSLTPQLRRKP